MGRPAITMPPPTVAVRAGRSATGTGGTGTTPGTVEGTEKTDAGLTAGIDAETATGAGGAGPRADQGPDPEIAATGGR